ncbi:MAG: hypothetical protein R3F60_13815 [bacterium]
MDAVIDADARGLEDGGGAPDGGDPDAGEADGALDGGPAGEPDGALDAALPVEVVGEARAADARLEVTVEAAGQRVQTVAGRYRLALPPGRHRLTFRAPDHEVIEQVVEVGDEAPAPVLLYRGVRIGGEPGATLQFRFDGGYVVWSEGDALLGSPTDVVAPRVLLAQDFEIFLGFSPDGGQVALRRRTRPGIAGDVDVIDLADGTRRPLFVEAQPWVRWRPDGRALGMVATREALSRLVVGRPGADLQVLAEGVPWLLVTDLLDGEVAWAERAGAGFGIHAGPLDAAAPVAAGFPSGDAFLSNTPGRAGLLWLGPAGELTRWEPGQGARILAREVVASPRPRFLPGGALLFFRADPAGPALRQVWVLDDAGERLLADEADGDSFASAGELFYVARPDQGLWRGRLAGGGEEILAGDVIRLVLDGPGGVAVADGAAYHVTAEGAATPLGVEGLSQLTYVSTGATAWQAATRTLWYLPGPGRDLRPAALVVDAPRASRVGEPGGRALYVLGSQGFFRAPVPPGPPPTPFDVDVDSLAPVNAGQLLGWRDRQALSQIDPTTGAAFGWAADVRRVVVGGPTQAAYVSDRGTYLAFVGE